MHNHNEFSPHFNPIFGNFEEFRGKIFDLRAKTFEKKNENLRDSSIHSFFKEN